MKKIVITGLGMVTPVGNGKDATWSSLEAGKCGIGRITRFDPSRCTCQVAGELKDFDAYLAEKGYVDRKAARHMDPFSIYGVAAAVEAWKDAGFTDENKPDMDRVATIIGNGIGGMKTNGESWKTLFDRGPDRLSPLAIPELIANEGAGNISMALGAKGH